MHATFCIIEGLIRWVTHQSQKPWLLIGHAGLLHNRTDAPHHKP